MPHPSITFTHALCRTPCATVSDGLRALDTGTPDLSQFLKAHAAYVATLRSTGAQVTVLPPLDPFPDSVFIEDTALCLPDFAVLMRPDAPTRQGEVEGGDILTTGSEILVGRSARTNAAGIEQLRRITAAYGYSLREVTTPPEILHFKTDCSLLDPETILATPRLAATGCFDGYRVLTTRADETAAANAVRFNDLVLLPAGFDHTAALLDSHGYHVTPIDNTRAAKPDGGMSCLSLRFSPPQARQ
jgi:dimethylargininase